MLDVIATPVTPLTIVADCLQGSNTKKLRLHSEYTADGKVSTTIKLYHNDKLIDTYWGLPQALEAYNNIK